MTDLMYRADGTCICTHNSVLIEGGTALEYLKKKGIRAIKYTNNHTISKNKDNDLQSTNNKPIVGLFRLLGPGHSLDSVCSEIQNSTCVVNFLDLFGQWYYLHELIHHCPNMKF